MSLCSLWGEVRSQVNGPPWRGDPLISTQSPLGLNSESLGSHLRVPWVFFGKSEISRKALQVALSPGLVMPVRSSSDQGQP